MKKFIDKELCNALRQTPTSELDAILADKLNNNPADQNSINLILRELKRREKGYPNIDNDKIRKCWIKYLSSINVRKKNNYHTKQLIKLAVIIMLIGCLFVFLPKKVTATTFWERIGRWTEDFLELFAPDRASENIYEYSYNTNNDGLLELYNEVVGLGVTCPAVPMWLPDGYELKYITNYNLSDKIIINAVFQNEDSYITWQVDILTNNIAKKYYKDKMNLPNYEFSGVSHYIIYNICNTSIVWTRDNYEFLLTIDCSEDLAYRIIRSIYVPEEQYETIDEDSLLCADNLYSVCNTSKGD